jgi:uncharacterized protein DUF350
VGAGDVNAACSAGSDATEATPAPIAVLVTPFDLPRTRSSKRRTRDSQSNGIHTVLPLSHSASSRPMYGTGPVTQEPPKAIARLSRPGFPVHNLAFGTNTHQWEEENMQTATFSQAASLSTSLVFALLAVVLSVLVIVGIDRFVYRNIDFIEEIKKGNVIAGVFYSVQLLFVGLVVAVAIS